MVFLKFLMSVKISIRKSALDYYKATCLPIYNLLTESYIRLFLWYSYFRYFSAHIILHFIAIFVDPKKSPSGNTDSHNKSFL